MDVASLISNHGEDIYLKDKLIDDTISYGKWINHKIVDWTGVYEEPYIHPIKKEDSNLKFDQKFKRSMSEGYSFLIQREMSKYLYRSN